MKLLEKKKKNATIFLKLKADKNDIKEYKKNAINYYKNNLEFEGFRKGKAPDNIVVKKVGEKEINLYAKKMLIYDYLMNFLKTEGIKSLNYDPVVNIKEDVFNIKIFLDPEVKLCDYKKIKSKMEKINVEKKDIESTLEELRRKNAIKKEILEPSKKGDFITLDFDFQKDGKPIQGLGAKNFVLKIGQGLLFEEFEKNLIGLKKGETKRFSLVIPPNFYKKELQGKEVEIFLKVKKVERDFFPELNDEFARSISKFKNLDELRKSIKQGIKKEKQELQKRDILNKKLEEIIKNSSFEIHEHILEQELNYILMEIDASLKERGLNLEIYIKNFVKDKNKFLENLKKEAEKRVKIKLVIRKIAENESLVPDNKEVTNFLNEKLKYAYNIKELKKIKPERLMEAAREELLQKKVINFLISY